MFFQHFCHCINGQRVAINTEPADQARGGKRHVGMMAEGFAFVGVGDVKLNDGLLEHVEGIKNSHRCVGECGWIDDNPGGTIDAFVDSFYNFIVF